MAHDTGTGPSGRRLLLPSEMQGSHQHYFHLLLGNILPCCAVPDEEQPHGGWLFPDPGPLAPLLRELRIDILPRPAFLRATRRLRRWEPFWRPHRSPLLARRYRHLPAGQPIPIAPGLEAVRLDGFDVPDRYPVDAIRRGAAGVRSRLRPAASAGPDVLVIDRGGADPFYASEAVLTGSGTARRSLPNAAALAQAIGHALSADVACVTLEGLSLSEQIARFSQARLIVAQHGAALGNLVWCPADACVLEILPPDPETYAFIHFRQLAAALGLRYAAVAQATPHAAVDEREVARMAAELVGVGAFDRRRHAE